MREVTELQSLGQLESKVASPDFSTSILFPPQITTVGRLGTSHEEGVYLSLKVPSHNFTSGVDDKLWPHEPRTFSSNLLSASCSFGGWRRGPACLMSKETMVQVTLR